MTERLPVAGAAPLQCSGVDRNAAVSYGNVGELLNALGFPFFEPGREYSLSGVDQDGVVEVSSWESDEGPDEDGFGREEFYDWWYLNEYLVLPKGVGYIHSYSNLDKRNSEEKFRALHDRVAAIN